MVKGHGKLFVVSAPSGAGKTSLCRELIEQVDNIRFSVSHTTRTPRPNEVDAHDYHFIERKTFLEMVERKEFLEWAEVHGNLYGTSLDEWKRAKNDGADLLLDIEGVGAMQAKSSFPDAILVFIITPNLEELRLRLYGRHSDSEEEIERRFANAKKEISYLPKYDYIVINKDFDMALLGLMSIVYAERSRREVVIPSLPEEFKPA
jgi:guanylate kinase